MTRCHWPLIVLAVVPLVGCAETGTSKPTNAPDLPMQINYTYPFDCPAVPNCVPIRHPLCRQASYSLRKRDGKTTPAQFDEQGRLWFWQEAGKEGEVVQYLLDQTKPSTTDRGVEVIPVGPDKVEVRIKGQLFTAFQYPEGEDEFKPFLYPVIGPTDEPVTRDYPMRDNPIEKENKRQDHPHHRSLWCAHGDVRTKNFEEVGTDYWSQMKRPQQGRQVVRRIARTASGPVFGLIEAEIDWLGPDGQRQLAEMRTYTFFIENDDLRVIDAKSVFTFPEGDVMFADTKEGGVVSIRLAASMDEKGIDTPRKLQGRMTNSRGGVGAGQCWGKQAEWCDYYGPTLSGAMVGIAIMDSPSNPRHPTYWHIRDYGLYTANPFGVKDFTRNKDLNGSLVCKQGERLEFNYRVLIHKGDTRDAHVDDCYKMYRIPLDVVSK